MRKSSRWFLAGAAIVSWGWQSHAEGFDLLPTRAPSVSDSSEARFPGQTIQFISNNDTADNLSCVSGCNGDDDCQGNDGCCCDGIGNWRDNTQVWFGGDAYKSLGDSGLSGFTPLPFSLGNNFGLTGGFNTGFRLGDSKVRGQVGASYGAYDFKGRTTVRPLKPNSLEQQTFVTMGLSKRSDIAECERISWGLVYDMMFDHQWGWAMNEVNLGQVRGILGYAINESNEIGVWGTIHTQEDQASFSFPPGAVRTNIRAMNQANTYWRYNYAFGGETMAYVGVADNADLASWQFGMLNTAPLSDSLSLYSNFTYVAPRSATGLVGAAQEQWNISVGLMYSFGGKAVSPNVSGQQGLPLMPVANNGSFLITN